MDITKATFTAIRACFKVFGQNKLSMYTRTLRLQYYSQTLCYTSILPVSAVSGTILPNSTPSTVLLTFP